MKPRVGVRRASFVALLALLAAPASAQVCGDAVCNGPGESQCNCPADCPASASDGCCVITGAAGDSCNTDPTACACPGATGPCTPIPPPPSLPFGYVCTGCGDSVCDSGENHCNCPDITFLTWTGDCAAACGDGCCTSGENANDCATDCLSECGNLICEPGEDDCSCAGEGCGAPCGDDMCCAAGGETPSSCAADCSVCGDSLCTGAETCESCVSDCACTGGEVCRTDLDPPTCGAAGLCSDGDCVGETCGNCPGDCGACADGGSPDGDGGGNEGEAEAEGEPTGPKNLYACDCSIGSTPFSSPISWWLWTVAAALLYRRRPR